MLLLVFTVSIIQLIQVESNTLCVKNDAFCTFQNESIPNEACYMSYFPRNTSTCASLQLTEQEPHHTDLTDISLHTYEDHEFERILFNVTFTKIKWKNMWMRFMLNQPDSAQLNSRVNTCRAFKIWDNVSLPKESELYYDCPWSLRENSGQTFLLHYQGVVGDLKDWRKFIFNIPSYESMSELVPIPKRQLFLYIDYTKTELLKLHIQLLPNEFKDVYYKIEIMRERGKDESLLQDIRFITPNKNEKEAVLEYSTWNERGHYYFLVSFINEMCPEDECIKTQSPKVFISRRSNNLVIGIVGASIIIPILLFTVFIWNKQCQLKESLVADADTKVLLIYTPSTDAHNNVVITLTQTLQKVFNIDVLLDVLQIPCTNHKDPLLWCSQAFEAATHVVYVASPDVTVTKPPLYRTQEAAMRFLREDIGREGSKTVCSVTFLHCRGVPEILRNFTRFDLMKDFDGFVSFLVRYNKQSAFLCKSIFKRNRLMFYSENQYFIDFVEAVKKAGNEKEVKRKAGVKPEIKVSVVGEGTQGHGNEEEEQLIESVEKEKFSFDVRELNLSGEKKRDMSEEKKRLSQDFDIQNLDL